MATPIPPKRIPATKWGSILLITGFLFSPKATRVACECSIRADDAVTWNDERDLVRTLGSGPGARCGRSPDLCGELSVAARFASGDFTECLPDFTLERRSVVLREGHVEGGSFPRKEISQFCGNLICRLKPTKANRSFRGFKDAL